MVGTSVVVNIGGSVSMAGVVVSMAGAVVVLTVVSGGKAVGGGSMNSPAKVMGRSAGIGAELELRNPTPRTRSTHDVTHGSALPASSASTGSTAPVPTNVPSAAT